MPQSLQAGAYLYLSTTGMPLNVCVKKYIMICSLTTQNYPWHILH